MLLGTPPGTSLRCTNSTPPPSGPEIFLNNPIVIQLSSNQLREFKMKLASFLATAALAQQDIHTFQFNIANIVYEGRYEIVKRDFWATKEHCDSLGGGWQMPTPTNANENLAAFKIAQGRGNIFIGIAQHQNQDAELSSDWFNVYTEAKTTYTNWMWNQPNNFRGVEDFAVMLK